MRYIKKYNNSLVLEKLNPIDEYILPLVDLGFKVELDSRDIGKLTLNLKSDKLTDELRLEIFNEYLTMIDRLKDNWEIKNHSILFSGDSDVSISLRRKVKNAFDEVEIFTSLLILSMTPEQKVAYESIKSSIPADSSLVLNSASGNSIEFNLKKEFISKWVDIHKDGRINLPMLRGSKSGRRTDLPFDNRDIKWFKRIIEVDSIYDRYNSKLMKEMDDLHRKTQQELREIYK